MVVHTMVRGEASFWAASQGLVSCAVVKTQGERDTGREAGHRSSPAGNSDVGSRHEHPRADNVSSRNRVTQGDVAKRAVNANIADRCKSGLEGDARVGNGFKCNMRRGFLEMCTGIGITRDVHQV